MLRAGRRGIDDRHAGTDISGIGRDNVPLVKVVGRFDHVAVVGAGTGEGDGKPTVGIAHHLASGSRSVAGVGRGAQRGFHEGDLVVVIGIAEFDDG